MDQIIMAWLAWLLVIIGGLLLVVGAIVYVGLRLKIRADRRLAEVKQRAHEREAHGRGVQHHEVREHGVRHQPEQQQAEQQEEQEEHHRKEDEDPGDDRSEGESDESGPYASERTSF